MKEINSLANLKNTVTVIFAEALFQIIVISA